MSVPQPKSRPASGPDPAAASRPKKPGNLRDLETEIVRDLEVSSRAEDIRGGACPTSKPV
jgi:hypothetical protein